MKSKSEYRRWRLNRAINRGKASDEEIRVLYDKWWGDHSYCRCEQKVHDPSFKLYYEKLKYTLACGLAGPCE